MPRVRSWRASERMRWAISAPGLSPRTACGLGGVTLGATVVLGGAGFALREEARIAAHLESEDFFFGTGSSTAALAPAGDFIFVACAFSSSASPGFSVANVTLLAWRSLRIDRNTGARKLSPSVQFANFTRATNSGLTHSTASASLGTG